MKFILLLTVLGSGLVAGLLYAYSCSVNPGLKNLNNTDYIKAMQAINVAIQNPVFFISFIGLLFVFPLASYLSYKHGDPAFVLMLVSMLIYFVGVFGVTLFLNVPLNNQLAKFTLDGANENDITAMRQLFEKPWNTYHSIRTVAAITSFILSIAGVLKGR